MQSAESLHDLLHPQYLSYMLKITLGSPLTFTLANSIIINPNHKALSTRRRQFCLNFEIIIIDSNVSTTKVCHIYLLFEICQVYRVDSLLT